MQQLNQNKGRKISTPDNIQTPKPRYNYDDALKKVVKCGKKLYGPNFKIFEEDRATILKLLSWFHRDEALAEKEKLSLEKGILLTGPPGCGKSAIMNIICSVCEPSWKFIIKSSPQIIREFESCGYRAFDGHTVRSVCLNQNPRTVCFDDLGSEKRYSHHDLHYNPLAEILLFRYEMMVEHKLLTHITTNFNNEALEERYGWDLSNCLSEMFNLVAFPPTSINKHHLKQPLQD